jgi:single-strand DNA-binding protein
MAVNETYRDRQTGQPKEVACFVDVTVWEKQADSCGQYLTRGSQILVEGRLIYEEWKNAQGEARNRLSVRADRVQFLNTTRRPEPSGQQAAQGAAAPAQAPAPAAAQAPSTATATAPVPVATPAPAPAEDDVPF